MKQVLFNLIAVIVAVLAPIHALIISVIVLILLDLFTGIWASLKLKKPIRSAAMRRTVSKIFIYELAIIAGFLVEQYMLDNFLPVSKIVASVIGLVELKSILENSNHILGYPLFKSVVAKLGSENDNLKEQIMEDAKQLIKKELE